MGGEGPLTPPSRNGSDGAVVLYYARTVGDGKGYILKRVYAWDYDIEKTIMNIGSRLKNRHSTKYMIFSYSILIRINNSEIVFYRLNSNAPGRFVRHAYLTGVLLAFLVARTYHVVGDLLGRVTHFLTVLVGYDRHVDLLQDVGRLFALAQPAPSDHGAFDADVRRVGCGPNGFVFRIFRQRKKR